MAEFKPLTEAEFAARSMKPARHTGMVAESAEYDPNNRTVVIRLANGVGVAFPLAALPGLESASSEDLSELVVEGGGYGLHVPALDADISIPQLFADQLGADRMMKRFRRASASRTNGKLGGRPRKVVVEAV